jgi:hypothetical protein
MRLPFRVAEQRSPFSSVAESDSPFDSSVNGVIGSLWMSSGDQTPRIMFLVVKSFRSCGKF